MQILAALIAGLVFGVGLVISGMSNPAKVLNFLDVTGTWDPSLILVMAGAIAVTLPGYLLLRRRERPLLAPAFSWPNRTQIDRRLVMGAAWFGVGWGLVGLCPGPALTGITLGGQSLSMFLATMVLGLWLGARFSK